MTRPPSPLLTLLAVLALLATACGDDDGTTDASDGTSTSSETTAPAEDVTLTLLTHDSFVLSDGTLETFTDDTGIEVEILQGGDAGSVLNQAILTKDDPEADVLFGVDNTFLSRALHEDLFVPYESSALDRVTDDSLILDPEHRVTPIDTGDVCLNYDVSAFEETDTDPPTSLEDLTDPAHEDQLVVENPATSSPGLSFLLATIARFGDDWTSYWEDLRDNGVEVTSGWEEAYYGSFSGSADSTGDRPIVVSYASSPAAEVVFAEEPPEEAPTGVVIDSCFRQIEFAGILANTAHEQEARQLIDFMLSDTFQADIPLNMFVFPVTDVELPEAFVEHARTADDPLFVEPERIAENREEWIDTWTDVVLR